jgi:hypothetical protein
MTRIEFSRAWCADCFDDCYWSYNAQTGITRHIGSGTLALAAALNPLKRAGYYISHRGHGDYTATLYKAAPIALPLDWQMAMQLADQRETVDQDQDW